jgi:hypothetical protein
VHAATTTPIDNPFKVKIYPGAILGSIDRE